VPEVVPADAGILVPPGDVGAFAEALAAVLGDRARADGMAAAARAAGMRLPQWTATAATVRDALARAA
jgi:glycosyltransferase involved in cell wall biosynthesis